MSINLIIKGNVAQATEAARQRGISLNQCRPNLRHQDETFARCASDYHVKVVGWFHEEPMQAPYSVGALLLFS